MKVRRESLYKKDEAKYLEEREVFWERDKQEKFSFPRCKRYCVELEGFLTNLNNPVIINV